MSPLAQLIAKQLTLPVKDRELNDEIDLMHKMADVHCFDVTGAVAIIDHLADQIFEEEADVDLYAFLPAEKTWIEARGARTDESGRIGWLLTQRGEFAEVIEAYECAAFLPNDPPTKYCTARNQPIMLGAACPVLSMAEGESEWRDFDSHAFLYAALAVINTPRIVGRRQHMPHRGLEKSLIRARKTIGSFPLHAWTEIKLEVGPPESLAGSGTVEAHLTGDRCLHFCRAHLRVRRGRLEIVKGHWRGDAALGIRRSRYSVRPRASNNSATAVRRLSGR